MCARVVLCSLTSFNPFLFSLSPNLFLPFSPLRVAYRQPRAAPRKYAPRSSDGGVPAVGSGVKRVIPTVSFRFHPYRRYARYSSERGLAPELTSLLFEKNCLALVPPAVPLEKNVWHSGGGVPAAGVARACARGGTPTARRGATDGGFRLEAAEEGPRARPCSDGLIHTTGRVHEATLP